MAWKHGQRSYSTARSRKNPRMTTASGRGTPNSRLESMRREAENMRKVDRQRSRPHLPPPPDPSRHFDGIVWAIKWMCFVALACLVFYYLLVPIIVSIIAALILLD